MSFFNSFLYAPKQVLMELTVNESIEVFSINVKNIYSIYGIYSQIRLRGGGRNE